MPESPKRQSAAVHQVIVSPVEQHSKKPDVVRDRIVTLMGDLSRVELFARQTVPGWDAWGNEGYRKCRQPYIGRSYPPAKEI